jgi:hypothetical protein
MISLQIRFENQSPVVLYLEAFERPEDFQQWHRHMLRQKPVEMSMIARRVDTGLPCGLLLNPDKPVSAYTCDAILRHAAKLYLAWIKEFRSRNTSERILTKLNELEDFWIKFL